MTIDVSIAVIAAFLAGLVLGPFLTRLLTFRKPYGMKGVLSDNDEESDFRTEVLSEISRVESDVNIRLSDSAKRMLTIPLTEIAPFSSNIPGFDNWKETIYQVIASAKESPAYTDVNTNGYKSYSSLSVLKAYSARWCNIPPICREK